MRFTPMMMSLAMTMLLFVSQFQNGQGLALVPRPIQTALLSRFGPRPAAAITSTYALSQPEEFDRKAKASVNVDTSAFQDDSMAAYKSEMLNLVYERSMHRLLDD